MTVEVRLMGVACNLACTYCYQEPQRVAGNRSNGYDIDKVIDELEKTGQSFHLFGGEALLTPKRDLERLWKYGYEKYGNNGIQTNGTLIDDDHIELFKKYNVHVGVSIDGPNELNKLRRVRGKDIDSEETLNSTKKIMDNLIKLKEANISVGVIITLHRENASKEKLPRLLSFMRWLGDIGITGGNVHKLEIESTMPDQEIHVLTQEENAYAIIEIANFLEENKDLRWNPFIEIPHMLGGDDSYTTCYWNYCDPMNTQAVYGIEGDGALSNCGRTNKEGIDWYKADDNKYARYISLYHTPQDMGGCQGCRFWITCGGSCPGEGDEGDLRNKTSNCHTMKVLQSYYEKKLEEQGIKPITKNKFKRELIEQVFLGKMYNGEKTNIHHALQILDRELSNVKQVEVIEEGEELEDNGIA